MSWLTDVLRELLDTDEETMTQLVADLPSRPQAALPAGAEDPYALIERIRDGELSGDEDLDACARALGIEPAALLRMVSVPRSHSSR